MVGAACPSWCIGHEGQSEHRADRWHVGDGVEVALVERGHLAADSTPRASDVVVLVEQHADDTTAWVLMGPNDDVARTYVLSSDSAARLGRELLRAARTAVGD